MGSKRLRGFRETGPRLGYRGKLCCRFIWEISARSTGMNFKTDKIKMAPHKVASFAAIVALLSHVTLLTKPGNIHSWKKYAFLTAVLRK